MDSLYTELMNTKTTKCVQEISSLSFPIPWSLESIEKELTNKFARYVTLKNNDKVIGFGGMWVIFEEAHITNIALHPEYREMGYSHIILDSLESICKKEGVTAMTLEVRASNIAAQKLYEHHGFKVEGIRKGYYEDNKEDGLIMWKRDI
ncbi:ribosomal-protein-alanine acetyltransferase [Clostridium argentinense CDC 2741]|uniref:[Ribosomal protein bS18]-alanine N-acetyltransferase n=1 Tax=Clostridium argentinense CDC 2741 TaxID=1418104 RepID=A0A0C1QXC5_9CLOT|nr:ribosomal protein S18-alanine N-acetyltransferase [Clostridium argentinense]ARC86762.1 ribosomal-protein-alanine N-acetyltransferase RimI [Clostridium argentinense]KIE45662.1 ribosomal-protein-alanine acetyltransferase [Clostridium argentinense CDC 2741]NFF38508.1 ribosomal-protein-alanine N-acetyltransferase [Clostridium argentinense]NFP49299.1 ribosomal-protein-alanine N-acetyltransferase [Clostridium argentinense]NFP71702.1 ribosomal-protein-alanine N-acetyltransferase [Clostridium argen